MLLPGLAPEVLPHDRTKRHELDFATAAGTRIEVKRGRARPRGFAWIPEVLPRARNVLDDEWREASGEPPWHAFPTGIEQLR